MSAVSKVAIVGGGVAGMVSAIVLADGGVEVDVYEAKSEVTALGSGITLQGNALRVFDQVGIWERIQEQSYSFDEVSMRAPDPAGTVIASLTETRTGGPDYPATAGMYRPDLAKILAERALEVGARIHYGTTVTGLEQAADGVTLTTDAGDTSRVDLVIGADGLNSPTRSLIGIETKPERTGMGIWRAFVERPAEVTHTDLYYGGRCFIAGYCPTGENSIYAYLVEKAQDRTGLTPAESVEIMRDLAGSYGGPWQEIRDSLTESARVHYTLFTSHVVPDAWNRGRVVIIGDAAHSCPPTIAQGAAQASEDGLVLATMLLESDQLDQQFWDDFHARRIPRAAHVVEASTTLGQWQLEGKRDGNVPALMGGVAQLVAVPA
ncbi:2-polyprenyl-6-methoxyphenol hydroxylase [Pseudoclavibacter sp. AY1F1]|uniref:FAD-dependent monooxygenase n=1 Tax=Pseudoclavibacter sp. AY1F1 TaxID=2080583 RepID=UPI000CE8B9E7|nr:FAD-dependent monooxygenase [Pseudoclavibacter sp. AY1F1]PPF43315.1 2-polyprenyl-6-methoxyphenol hydroxylase [Pseudoclavibacter sp. AY1F1]